MNMRDLEIVIQEIRDVFGDMPYPGTEYIMNDLEGNDLERKQIREGFSRYENWQDVPRELLLQERMRCLYLSHRGSGSTFRRICCSHWKIMRVRT